MKRWKMIPAVRYTLSKNVVDEFFQRRAIEDAKRQTRNGIILNMLAAGMKPSEIATMVKMPLAYVENVKARA